MKYKYYKYTIQVYLETDLSKVIDYLKPFVSLKGIKGKLMHFNSSKAIKEVKETLKGLKYKHLKSDQYEYTFNSRKQKD